MKEVLVEKKELNKNVGVNFKVIEGMIIEGKTMPPVAGAEVTIQRDNQLSIKDRQPIVTTTDAEGRFRSNPVDKDTYHVEMVKEDFIFTRLDPSSFDFKAIRVASLEVNTHDGQGVALADVFITVSAGRTILKGQTGLDGKLKFSAITPQKYYITAIKKEYSFGAIEALEILEEDQQIKVLTGQRVAFSAFGIVNTLQGRPVSEGNIIAKHGDNIEQAAIQADGTFRLMGLKPASTYTLVVESALVERTLPNLK